MTFAPKEDVFVPFRDVDGRWVVRRATVLRQTGDVVELLVAVHRRAPSYNARRSDVNYSAHNVFRDYGACERCVALMVLERAG